VGNQIIIKSENVRILTDVGLTVLQAKIFLGILASGKADVGKISKITGIDRSNIYKTIKDLEELELIEKYVGKSAVYAPIPIQMAINILCERKKHDYIKSVEELNQLAKEIDPIDKYDMKKMKDYFKILPSGTEIFSRNWEKTLKKIEHSIDLIVTEHREIKDEPVWDIYENLLQRGINVRWLFDRSEKNDQEFVLRIKQFEKLLKYPELEIRACFDCLRPFGGVLDNNMAVIFLDRGSHLKCVRSLWTNNPEIVLNFREHFNTCWEKSVSCPVQMIIN
jgi:sugar-specific transcriptional regulator TrmB